MPKTNIKLRFYKHKKGGEFELTKYTCNKCGKEFDMWDASEHFHIHQRCGYGTKFDGDDLELDLCCSCMEELIDSCTISPIIEKNT